MSVRFSELEGARVGIWGAGREVGSFAEQLARRLPTARIVAAAFDTPPAGDIGLTLHAPAVRVLAADQAVAGLGGCDVVVRSPGVPLRRMELRELSAAGVPITTPTALWLAEHGGEGVVGVTGTKGKSTTAALLHHLLLAAGRTVYLAGNIGVPALDLLDREPVELTVLELSSYQIADLRTGPEVALFTNLYREHTDWHGSEEAYRADKLRLLELPGVRIAVLNARDPLLQALSPETEVRRYGTPSGWDVSGTGVLHGGAQRMAIAELPLPGEHNALNLCGALTALEALGVSVPPLPGALEGFLALPHRLQTLLSEDGLTWVDDSISTTPESTLAALESFSDRPILLIAGGQDRGQDYTELGRVLYEVGATVIGIPSTGGRLLAAARRAGMAQERTIEVADLGEAVSLARSLALGGEVVLLSPAAPSYDHYRDFEQRGERFRDLALGR
jgi:UDP-N-acetylmuramoyl-L-alanine---L-glutamate ligase